MNFVAFKTGFGGTWLDNTTFVPLNQAVKNTKDIIELCTEDRRKIEDLGRPIRFCIISASLFRKKSIL